MRCWQPLKKSDTESSWEKQHGVLFHMAQWRAMSQALLISSGVDIEYDLVMNDILPIGYQPFQRCHSQYAYGIHMKKEFPLQKDDAFEKLYFRHSEKLSQDVFEMMNGGKSIYPLEGLNDYEEEIAAIKHAIRFSEEALVYAVEKNEYYDNLDKAASDLKEKLILGEPILITGNVHPYSLTEERRLKLDKQYVGFDLKEVLGGPIMCRRCYIPSHKSI